MTDEPKIPVVAAFAVVLGVDYDESLAIYKKAGKKEQAGTDETYLDNNMGYGIKAWEAYLAAEKEQIAVNGENWRQVLYG